MIDADQEMRERQLTEEDYWDDELGLFPLDDSEILYKSLFYIGDLFRK